MVVLILITALISLSLMVWSKTLTVPMIFIGIMALSVWVCAIARASVRKREIRPLTLRRLLRFSFGLLMIAAVLSLSFWVLKSILIPGILVVIIAFILLIGSIIKVFGQRESKKLIEWRPFVILFISLFFIDLIISFWLILFAGLGHSVRAGKLGPFQWLLSFVLVVMCPLAAAILYRYYRLSGPERIRKAKILIATATVSLFVVVVILLGLLGGWPPLLFAARYGYSDLGKTLIRWGADVNARDPYDGSTPLGLAICRDDLEMARLLLEKGADVNAKAKENDWTPLMDATARGHKEMVNLLLEKRAEVNAKTKDGWTALMWAFSRGDLEMVKILRDQGADFNFKFKDGHNVMMDATVRGDKQEIQRLLKLEALRNTKTPAQLGIELVSAAQNGRIEEIRNLRDIGADINFRYQISRTPLMVASSSEAAEILLNNGAEIEARDSNGWTALVLAVQAGRLDVAQLLLKRGADIQARDNHGRTVLMHAAWLGQPEMVRFLLDKGVDINAKDDSGNTALSYAARQKHPEVMDLLRAHGARE